jgi:hypothetical protein
MVTRADIITSNKLQDKIVTQPQPYDFVCQSKAGDRQGDIAMVDNGPSSAVHATTKVCGSSIAFS